MHPTTRLRLAVALTMSVLALAVGNVLADAASDYDTLFGAEAKKVAATSYKTDDVRFAAKLLKAAQDMPDSPGLQVLLYTNSVQFSSGSVTGCDTALEALSLLEKAAPAQKAQWRSKKLDVVKYRFSKSYGAARKTAGGPYMDMLESEADAMAARGEGAEAKALYNRAYMIANYIKSPRAREILAKGKRANAIALQQVKVKSLQSKLKANAQDAASRKELIDLYVIAMDQPEKAAGLLNEDIDEATRTYVSLAAGKLDGLDEAICLELGDWYYLELSKNALAKGKPAILQRAAGYYQKFLKDHTKKDAQTYRVTAAMAKIAKDLEKLGASVDGPSFGRTITLDLGKNVTLELVHIPAGQFMMDSPKTEIGREDNEGPQRLVTISKPFYMGVTEVTQSQFQSVVRRRSKPNRYRGPQEPAETLSWNEAMVFCRAMSEKTGRSVCLPTEAQWEYACRADAKTRFAFGDDDEDLNAYGWSKANSPRNRHRPVGLKKPNAFGLYDMHGNVWEWCSDRYAESYASAKTVDPKGPTAGQGRVLRGGAANYAARYCRSAGRYWGPADAPCYDWGAIGFRVVIADVSDDK